MNRIVLVTAALLALLPLAGCSVRVHDDDVKVAVGGEMIQVNTSDEDGVDVKVPGVSVSAGGKSGVDVKVPGVSVSAGGNDGVEVKVPGVSVNVPAGGNRSPLTVIAGGTVPVDFAVPAEAKQVNVDLTLPIGGLTVVRGGTDAVTGQIGYARTTPIITTGLSGGEWTVTIPQESKSVGKDNTRLEIPDSVLNIGTDLPTSLDLTVNLGDVDLDLQRMNLTSLKASLQMGDMTVQLPGDANVRLTLKQAMGTNNLTAAGFVKHGDVWVSPGFKNEDVVEVGLQVNMGSLTVVR